MNPDAIENLLAEMYASKSASYQPVAVSIDPHPRDAGYISLVDARGKPCAFMGYDLAAELAWIVP